MKSTNGRTLAGSCMALTLYALAAVIVSAQQMPQTTTEKLAGTSTATTQVLKGTVVQVEGNDLLVRMSSGDLRNFKVPESRKFVIDGTEVSVHDLRPGTRLTATVTTTTTPVTQRTTTVGTGKVWYVGGNTVILTLPNNENRVYKVKESYRFIVGGEKASVHDLRKGMVISAEKIVEEPLTEIASNTQVIGQAPPEPKPMVAQTTAPETHEPAPAAAPVAEPAPVPTEVATTQLPAKLPKTGSPLPLAGALGLLFATASFCLRRLRRP